MNLRQAAAALGSMGGRAAAKALTARERSERARKAGEASGKNMTPKQRSERARKAALASVIARSKVVATRKKKKPEA